MKLLFSLFIFSLGAFARDVIIVTYNGQLDTALLIQKILIEKIHIPTRLVRLEQTSSPCEIMNDPLVQICVNENGDMDIRKKTNNPLGQTFGVFQKGYETPEPGDKK
jgi:hypothetical protein